MAKILVAEDEETLRNVVVRALSLDGHEVHQAEDGLVGLEILRDERVDLLLSDIRMPVMDGIDLATHALEQQPGLRILFMTGYSEQIERARGLGPTIMEIIEKPFSMNSIRQAVAAALV